MSDAVASAENPSGVEPLTEAAPDAAPREWTLSGRFVDAAGMPVAGALVHLTLYDREEDRLRRVHVARVMQNGRFRWVVGAPVPYDAVLHAAARREEIALRGTAAVGVRRGAIELGDIPLVPRGTLVEGSIVDDDGAPIHGVSVTVSALADGRRGMRPSELTVTTTAQGAFRIPDDRYVVEDDLELRAVATDASGRYWTSQRIVRAGEDVGAWTLALRRGGVGARVLLPEAARTLDIRVGAGEWEWRLDGDGHFTTPPLRPGTYSFRIGGFDWRGRPVTPWPDLHVAADDFDAALEPRVVDLRDTILVSTLEVVGPDGAPISTTLHDAAMQFVSWRFERASTHTFAHVERPLRLVVMAPGYESEEIDCDGSHQLVRLERRR